MKRILLALAMVLLSLCVLISCSDEKEETVTPDNITEEEVRPGTTVEEAVANYYSLLYEPGFGGYLLAFPNEFVDGYQNELEYDDATFQEAIDNATYTIHTNRDIQYEGVEFHLDYEYLSHREMTPEEKAPILNDIVAYCYMTRGTIEDMVEYTYKVDKYGVDLETGEVLMHENEHEKLTLLYITNEGWCVSPTNFELP